LDRYGRRLAEQHAMTTTTLELPEAESGRMLVASPRPALWPLAGIVFGGVLTVAWTAFLGWFLYGLVADLASWLVS
jgi:uncharacterized protein (DUF697 family)